MRKRTHKDPYHLKSVLGSLTFCCGSGSGPLTNGSGPLTNGSGSETQKMRILRIRIPNTVKSSGFITRTFHTVLGKSITTTTFTKGKSTSAQPNQTCRLYTFRAGHPHHLPPPRVPYRTTEDDPMTSYAWSCRAWWRGTSPRGCCCAASHTLTTTASFDNVRTFEMGWGLRPYATVQTVV
jgi:hypothetical protein